MADGNVQDFFERVADSKMADGIGWRVAPGFTVNIKDNEIKEIKNNINIKDEPKYNINDINSKRITCFL